MPDPAQERLTIDIVSDVVCPWCYVGKRRLEAALARLAAQAPQVRPFVSWHPFQLNPDMPRSGIDRREYLERKFGGAARADQVYERVRAAGRSVGIAFAFERIERQPNTLDAHRLIAWAQAQGDADALVERLFRAYFLEGGYVGDRETLATLAGDAGYDSDAARLYLASDEGLAAVAGMDRRVRELGVDGVPFFIFEGRVAVSGAQEPEALLDAIEQARSAAPVGS
jgi:predicted DsbA family dithiol-disulfide isomerase